MLAHVPDRAGRLREDVVHLALSHVAGQHVDPCPTSARRVPIAVRFWSVGTPLGALLLDLDHFKRINDTFGHGRGDDVLAAVAEAMRGVVRASDFVGRYGGEEFLILLPDTDVTGAAEAAEKLRTAVARVKIPAIDRDITASIGVAILAQDGSDTDALIRNADRALYSAKANGRNRVEVNAVLELDPSV